MINYEDSTPIATPEQFRIALLALRDSEMGISPLELEILEAQHYAPRHTFNTTQLAEKVKLGSYSEANLNYGKLAHRMATLLKYDPGSDQENVDHWWRTLSYGEVPDAKDETKFYKWVMRPELVLALERMGWVKKIER